MLTMQQKNACDRLKKQHAFFLRISALLSVVLISAESLAFHIAITPGPRALHLQVGTGTWSAPFIAGGVPSSNPTINSVLASIPASSIGTPTVENLVMANPWVTNSPYNGAPYCAVPTHVYIGTFSRSPAGSVSFATLTATTPASLTSATGGSIPFSTISWVVAADSPTSFAPGTFAGGTTQTLVTYGNQWREGCLGFRFTYNQIAPAGVFTGRITYTSSMP